MKELIPSTMDRLHELSNKKGGLIGSSTGFKDLDKKLQGIQDGDETGVDSITFTIDRTSPTVVLNDDDADDGDSPRVPTGNRF